MSRITYQYAGSGAKRAKAWGKFLAGACLLAAMVLFFGSGYAPPGICGEVLRHNRQADIDASPFFYNDVENMADLIDGAEDLHRQAAQKGEADPHDSTATPDSEGNR